MAFLDGNIVSFSPETAGSYIATSTKIFSENSTAVQFDVETTSIDYVNSGDKTFSFYGCDITSLFVVEVGTPYVRSQPKVFSGGVFKSFVSALSITSGDDSVILQYGAGVDFVASDNYIYRGDTVTFTPQIFGNTFVTYMWDFGDGFTSTSESPSHQFLSTGTFSVSLTATDADGVIAYKYRKDFIRVYAATCDFSGTPTNGSSPLYVVFSSDTSGIPSISSIRWTFGDGTNSLEYNPNKLYTKPGVYDVALYCTNALETVSEVKTGYIVVTPADLDTSRSTVSFTLGIDSDEIDRMFSSEEEEYDEFDENETEEDFI